MAIDGPGMVRAKDSASSVPARRTVRLAQNAQVDTSGPSGGQITIRGGQIEMTESNVLADNTGAQGATGGVKVIGDNVRLTAGQVSASTRSDGRAGSVEVTAQGTLEVRNVGRISSITSSAGNAGTVTVQADRLVISEEPPSPLRTAITTQAERGSTGRGGEVTIAGREIEVQTGGAISSSTTGAGDAGTVRVQADRLVIDGGMNETNFTGIASQANPGSTGRGGAR